MEMQSLSTGSSSSEDEIAVYMGAVVARKPKKRKHKTWVRKIFRNREAYGTLNLSGTLTSLDFNAIFFEYRL